MPRDERSALSDHTQSALDTGGGRFQKKGAPILTSGEVPRLPSSSPWAQGDPTGVEPPLGQNIDELPALGGESPRSASAPVEVVSPAVETTDEGGAAGGLVASPSLSSEGPKSTPLKKNKNGPPVSETKSGSGDGPQVSDLKPEK